MDLTRPLQGSSSVETRSLLHGGFREPQRAAILAWLGKQKRAVEKKRAKRCNLHRRQPQRNRISQRRNGIEQPALRALRKCMREGQSTLSPQPMEHKPYSTPASGRKKHGIQRHLFTRSKPTAGRSEMLKDAITDKTILRRICMPTRIGRHPEPAGDR